MLLTDMDLNQALRWKPQRCETGGIEIPPAQNPDDRAPSAQGNAERRDKGGREGARLCLHLFAQNLMPTSQGQTAAQRLIQAGIAKRQPPLIFPPWRFEYRNLGPQHLQARLRRHRASHFLFVLVLF